MKRKVLIMGAAGRDFHNFNVLYRDNPAYEVVAFTATQIPNIEGRRYPPELAGHLYPDGIPIEPESELVELIRKHQVDEVDFAYSDVSHEYVMHRASMAIAAGANFILHGHRQTMIRSSRPVITVCAVRTGAGKSQVTRRVSAILREKGKRVVVIRHPMPYGDLVAQRVQRFASYEDLDRHRCSIEEREEYEPHLKVGTIVFAGVDYEAILREAEKEADVILWDGGNNDLPFYVPRLHLVVADPHRVGHELRYHPGEANLRMADVVIINKCSTAAKEDIEKLRKNVHDIAPNAQIIEAASPITVDDPSLIEGKRVLVIEDGPTLTHGEMKYGAGVVAAQTLGARELVDPRRFAVGSIADVYAKYPEIGPLLPAMGYGEKQVRDLERTINAVDCDTVVIGTPIDLARIIEIKRPSVRVRYELEERGRPTLEDVLETVI
jgi:predicted GTPase